MGRINAEITAAVSQAMRPASCHNLLASDLGAYGQDADFVRRGVASARETEPSKPAWVSFLLGAEEVPSLGFLKQVVAAAREAGAEGMVFYNYSEAPRRVLLEWLPLAL